MQAQLSQNGLSRSSQFGKQRDTNKMILETQKQLLKLQTLLNDAMTDSQESQKSIQKWVAAENLNKVGRKTLEKESNFGSRNQEPDEETSLLEKNQRQTTQDGDAGSRDSETQDISQGADKNTEEVSSEFSTGKK